MSKKWGEMTEEEREHYVAQDCPKSLRASLSGKDSRNGTVDGHRPEHLYTVSMNPGKRERPLSACKKAELKKTAEHTWKELMIGREVFTGDEFEKLECLEPFELRLLELHYVEKMTFRDITELTRIITVVDGKIVNIKHLPKSTVEWMVKKAVKKIVTSNIGQDAL